MLPPEFIQQIEEMPVGQTLSIAEISTTEQSRVRSELTLLFNAGRWRLVIDRRKVATGIHSLLITKVDWTLTKAQMKYLQPYAETLHLAYAPGESDGKEWVAARRVIEELKADDDGRAWQKMFGAMEVSEAWERFINTG